jgi:hypothetical protein
MEIMRVLSTDFFLLAKRSDQVLRERKIHCTCSMNHNLDYQEVSELALDSAT